MVGTPRSDRGSDQSTGNTVEDTENLKEFFKYLYEDVERRSRREESQSKDQGTVGKGPEE